MAQHDSIRQMRVLAGLESGRPGLPKDDSATIQLRAASRKKALELVDELNEWGQQVAEEADAHYDRARKLVSDYGAYMPRDPRINLTRIVKCLQTAFAATADMQVEADELIEQIRK